jgi:hypothetical protein
MQQALQKPQLDVEQRTTQNMTLIVKEMVVGSLTKLTVSSKHPSSKQIVDLTSFDKELKEMTTVVISAGDGSGSKKTSSDITEKQTVKQKMNESGQNYSLDVSTSRPESRVEATHPMVAKQVDSPISIMTSSESSTRSKKEQVAKRPQVDVVEEQTLTRQVTDGDASERMAGNNPSEEKEATHPTVAKQVDSAMSIMESSESTKNKTEQVASHAEIIVIDC